MSALRRDRYVLGVVLGCWGAVAISGALGCGRSGAKGHGAPSVSASATVASAHTIADGLSSASGFELVAQPDGLSVVWASAKPEAGWLLRGELAQNGSLRRSASRAPVPARTFGKVTDLSATFVGRALALAWIEQGAREARAAATFVDAARAPTLIDLGPAAFSAESARGNLALVAEPERASALALFRGLEAPCVEPQASACIGFGFRRLRPGVAENTGLPLSVPVPCAAYSVELALSQGRLHYGVCTREGSEPVTTMFSIQYSPEYARAEPLLKGCLPLGTVDAADRPWLVGDCHGRRKAATVPLMDEKVQTEYVDALEVACAGEHVELRKGRLVLTLREPRAGLQPILPANLLPSGARAGWTGQSLVAAYVVGTRLETRAYVCRQGSLQPL